MSSFCVKEKPPKSFLGTDSFAERGESQGLSDFPALWRNTTEQYLEGVNGKWFGT